MLDFRIDTLCSMRSSGASKRCYVLRAACIRKERSVPKSTGLRRRPQQTRGEHRINTILDAAATVFYEVGYAAATTNLIAKHAHTAIGSLYDFFPNKEAIAQRLFERYLSDLRQLY